MDAKGHNGAVWLTKTKPLLKPARERSWLLHLEVAMRVTFTYQIEHSHTAFLQKTSRHCNF
jgi:hypothetical protein